MIDVDIHNEQSHVKLDEPFLQNVTVHTLQQEGISTATVSIAVVDDATIHRLNREFLAHDAPTDVLSFLLSAPPDVEHSGAATHAGGLGRSAERTVTAEAESSRPPLEGEVVLSAETARRRAAEFDWSAADEVVLYLVHGLLHLAGYDDASPEERQQMRRREKAVLSHWNLVPHDNESMNEFAEKPVSRSDGNAAGGHHTQGATS